MQINDSLVAQRRLARQARQRFVEGLCTSLPDLDKTVTEFLSALLAQTGTQREMQTRRDAWLLYQQHHTAWLERTAKTWRDALVPYSSSSQGQAVLGSQFELLSDDVVENKIVAARMALTVAEQVSQQFDSLRQRTQVLEGQDMDSTDILRVETVCLKLVEQWVDAGLPRTDLLTVVDPLQRELAKQVQKHYQAVNVFYVEQGVAMPTDMRSRVRRTASGGVGAGVESSGSGGLASQALAQSRDAMAGMQGASGTRWGGPASGLGDPMQRPMHPPPARALHAGAPSRHDRRGLRRCHGHDAIDPRPAACTGGDGPAAQAADPACDRF